MSEDTIFEFSGHYRFQWEAAQNAYVLLYPEGMVKLGGSAGEILKRIDGSSPVSAIVPTRYDARAGFLGGRGLY